MNKMLFLVLCFLLLVSCNKYDIPKCSFNDATQELLWLKEIIDGRNANPTEDMRYCYVVQAKFKRKIVFLFNDCNPAIDKAVFLIDCEGNPVQNSDGENIGAGRDELKDWQIIWQPIDFRCDENGNTVI